MAGEGRARLTKRVVDAARPRAERFHVWDSELSGFGLRIEASGTKTFIVRYRAEGGGRNAPRRFMTVGRYGPLTPDEARSKARQILGAVATGHDPAGERTAKRTAMLVSELIDLYAAEGCVVQRGKRQGQPMKAATKRYTLARLRHHVVPLLGRKRANEIRAGDVERLVAAIEAGRTAKDETLGPRKRVIVRGGPGAARKVARDLSAVFTFAVRRRIAIENPCATAAINKTDNRRTRYLDLGEVRQLGAALVDMEARGLNPKAANIARLWALTGMRRNEQLCWLKRFGA